MSLFEKIVNVETGETELKPYTKEQLVEAEAAQKKLEQEIADKEAKQAAREAAEAEAAEAKASAESKLAALGLTEAEIAAIRG